MRDPAFTDEPFRVHTRWIETEWAGGVEPFDAAAAPATTPPAERETVVVEVGGKRLEVRLPAGLSGGTARQPAAVQPAPPAGERPGGAPARPAATRSPRPMQGTIVKVAVADGDDGGRGRPRSSCSRR